MNTILKEEVARAMTDPDYVMENMYIGLQKSSSDKALFKRHGSFQGTEEYVYIKGTTERISWNVKLPKAALEELHLEADDVWEQASKNTFVEGETVIMDLPGMLSALDGPTLPDNETPFQMYVITNPRRELGSAQALNSIVIRDFFKKEAPGCQKCLVLPSSIHECILIPVKEVPDLAPFNEMVREVNRSAVSKREQLSDETFVMDLCA